MREPNRQGQESWELAKHRSAACNRDAFRGKRGRVKRKLSNYPRPMATAPIAARHAPATNARSPDRCFAIQRNSKTVQRISGLADCCHGG